MGPLPVKVSHPVEAEVHEYQEFTGRFAAVETVDLRARVSGYLDEIHFKPGATVKKGDLLFTIDQRPYRAALASAAAEIKRAEAAFGLAKADFARAKRLVATKAISAEVRSRPTDAHWGAHASERQPVGGGSTLGAWLTSVRRR